MGRWRHAPLHLSPEHNVTQDIGRWQRKFRGKTHSYLWLGHLLSDQKQRPDLGQIQQPVREQMGRCVQCSVLFGSQFIIIPHLQIPSPKQTFVLATVPGGWGGRVGGYFHRVTWSLPCEKRRLWQDPKRKGEKGNTPAPEDRRLKWQQGWTESAQIKAPTFGPYLAE